MVLDARNNITTGIEFCDCQPIMRLKKYCKILSLFPKSTTVPLPRSKM